MLMRDRIMRYLEYINITWPTIYPGLTIEYGCENYGLLSIYVIAGYNGFYCKRVFHLDSMINDDTTFEYIRNAMEKIRYEVIEKGEERRKTLNSVYGTGCIISRPHIDLSTWHPYMPKPKKIILNDPATIILWSDNTKTIVKKNSKDKKFDPEKGIALCYMKKALGNKGNYNNVFKDWIK